MEVNKIPFNKPYLTGNETTYIKNAVLAGHVSGNGSFTKKCQQWLEERYGFKKCLLTTSCTDALEMTALLMNIQPGDEVIVPAYTFVSTALAFTRQGAIIKFVDSRPDHPGMNEDAIEEMITENTKAIVVVHYAGIACDMDKILFLAEKYKLYVVEDAAQAIDSYYKGKPLGSIGNLGCFSFHETKNIHCGEGGLLTINDEKLIERAEIIWEKGTNRAKFFRGEIDKYSWVDTGSSFLPSDLLAAFLYAQLESLDDIQGKRKILWDLYFNLLSPLSEKKIIDLPNNPDYASNNAHMFYIVCKSLEERAKLISFLKQKGILSVFHYLNLQSSSFMKNKVLQKTLFYTDSYSDKLLRLPLYYELTVDQIEAICNYIKEFYSLPI